MKIHLNKYPSFVDEYNHAIVKKNTWLFLDLDAIYNKAYVTGLWKYQTWQPYWK